MSGIPNTTFNRSIKDRFTTVQSERIVRVIRVLSWAIELFEGDREAVNKWLNEKNRTLSWQKPADVMPSETGALEVMRLITRIEHGDYS
jgi:putative toxin-antitoxin system antitoxin component (TIGR02293 family)